MTRFNSTFLIQTGLLSLGFDPGPLTGVYGDKTAAAQAAWQGSLVLDIEGLEPLPNDGTWPWLAYVDGDDIVLKGVQIVCFGTFSPAAVRSDAEGNEFIQACAVPMLYAGEDPVLLEEFGTSPLPVIPWETLAVIRSGDAEVQLPVVDIGPVKSTGAAIGLTLGAARLFKPDAEVGDIIATGDYRLVGAAQFLPAP